MKALPWVVVLALACATVSTTDRLIQAFYTAEDAYVVVANDAVIYGHLPRCSEKQAAPCSDQAVVDSIKKIDGDVWLAIEGGNAALKLTDEQRLAEGLTQATHVVREATSKVTALLAKGN